MKSLCHNKLSFKVQFNLQSFLLQCGIRTCKIVLSNFFNLDLFEWETIFIKRYFGMLFIYFLSFLYRQ